MVVIDMTEIIFIIANYYQSWWLESEHNTMAVVNGSNLNVAEIVVVVGCFVNYIHSGSQVSRHESLNVL